MKGKAVSSFTLTEKGKKVGAELEKMLAIGKRYICTGCGMSYATNSMKDFVAHCVYDHPDMIEDFVFEHIALTIREVPEQDEDDEPYDTLGSN